MENKGIEITERQNEVIQLLAEGKRPVEIAEILGISAHTVKTHIQLLYATAQVHNRYALVSWGFRNGILR